MAQPNWYRICVGCGNAKHKSELIRIVKRQDNSLEIDFQKNKSGRGAYICNNPECARLALQRRGLDRSFRIPVERQFYEQLIQQVKQIAK